MIKKAKGKKPADYSDHGPAETKGDEDILGTIDDDAPLL